MTLEKSTIDRPFIHPLVRTAFRGLGLLAPPVAAAAAERLFLRPRRFRAPERERDVLRTAERHSLETPRGDAVAWVWGRSAPASAAIPTVFLVHGWEGRASQLGAFVEPLLRNGGRGGLRVVAFDAPGHGEAPGRSSSLPAVAATLEAAARQWGPPAGLVAHSAGAIAATYALSRGLAVERAVFVAPGADLAGYTRWFGDLLGLTAASRRRLRERIERRIGVAYAELEPLETAPDQAAPLLVLSDRRDREARLDTVRALVRAWPGAELRVTEGLGHRRILRDRKVVAEAVAFLTGDEGAAAPVDGTEGRVDVEEATAFDLVDRIAPAGRARRGSGAGSAGAR